MRGHIAEKNHRYYPVISMKDPATGKWKRKWLSGHRTKREAERARAEAVTQAINGWFTMPSRETIAGLFRNYLGTTGANRVRPVTLQSYKSMIENHGSVHFWLFSAYFLIPLDYCVLLVYLLSLRLLITPA